MCLFFFGCRKKAEDFLYADFLHECLASLVITQLHVAFSRDGDSKVYVQHRIMEQGAEVWRLLSAGANVYLCGDAKHMAKDVEAALKDVLVHHGGMAEEKAMERLDRMQKEERFLKDVWSA